MDKVESANDNKQKAITRAQAFLNEWKKRRTEDELKFQEDLNNPVLKKKLEAIKGKTVKNGDASTAE